MTIQEINTRIAQGEDSRTQFKRGLGTGVMRAIELGAQVSFVSDRELNVFRAIVHCEPVNETLKSAEDDFAEAVFRVIQAEPGIRRPDLMKRVNASRATVARVIVALQAEHRIVFRGAPKNGGYYVIAKSIGE